MATQGRYQLRDPIGVSYGVVVQQGYEFTPRSLHALIRGASEAAVPWQSYEPELGIERLGNIRGTIGRAIIHHDRFEGLVRLAAD
jgi:hypothetical protein